MRAAALAVAVVAAFVGVMYLRFSGDSVPGPPDAAVGGTQCVIFRNVGGEASPTTCGPATPFAMPTPVAPAAPVIITTPNPTRAAPLPAVLSDFKVVPLQLGPAMDIPKDIALILETGCWGCEGGPTGLVRVYTRPDGSLAYDSLLDPAKLGLPTLQYTLPDGSVHEYAPSITGYATTPDASDILASLCLTGTCAPDGLSSWSAESKTVLFRSRDGGVTWSEVDRLDVGAAVLALYPDGRTLLSTYDTKESTALRVYPGLSELQLPPDVIHWGVKVLANGDLVLRDNNLKPVRSDGSPLIPALAGADLGSFNQLLFDPVSMDGLTIVSSSAPGAPSKEYLVPFDSTGELGRWAFALAGDGAIWSTDYVFLGFDLTGGGLILGNANVRTDRVAPNGQPYMSLFVPVVLDLPAGIMRPIRPFLDVEVPVSRNLVAAVKRGPFARVVNTDNTCLNIRAEPLPSAGILDCAAEGVLLTDLVEFREGGGTPWRRVRTPAGAEGWASMEFLEADPAYGHD